MKSNIITFALSLATVCMVSSCLGTDDDDTTTYDDTALSAFTLGTVKYYRYKKASDGVTDTLYSKGSVTGSSYAVYIDQYKGIISNENDSLPVGSDLKHVLLTASATNNGIVTLEDSTGQNFYSFSSTDSLDFSKPRRLRVYSSSQKYYRQYTVNIVAHQEFADSFKWSKVDNIEAIKKYSMVEPIMYNNKSLYFNNSIVILAKTNTTKELSTYASGNWQMLKSFGKDATMAIDDNMLYVADNGTIYTTSDLSSWETTDAANVKCLYGFCGNEMYALSTDNKMIVSFDKGKTWNDDNIDSDSKYLPENDISFVTQTTKTNADVKRAYIFGTSENYTNDAVVWSKIVEENSSSDQDWMYQNFNERNSYTLPYDGQLSVVPYNDGLLALYATGTQLLFSQDCGITWKSSDKFELPSGLSDTYSATMTVDKDNFLWIIDFYTGNIWKGRLNSEGWTIKD